MTQEKEDAQVIAAECIRQSEEGNYERSLFRNAGETIQRLLAELEAVGAGGVQPLRAEGGPPGSGGWMLYAQEMMRERDCFRRQFQIIQDHKQGEVWYWQGDGGDHLESMANSLPVVIRAEQLRALLAGSKAPQQAAQEKVGRTATNAAKLSDELLRLANIMRDCGRLISKSGTAESVMREAAAVLNSATDAPAEQEAIAWLVTWKVGQHTYAQAHASELSAVEQSNRMSGTVTPCAAFKEGGEA